jgi:hypothetical protein
MEPITEKAFLDRYFAQWSGTNKWLEGIHQQIATNNARLDLQLEAVRAIASEMAILTMQTQKALKLLDETITRRECNEGATRRTQP